MATSSENVLCLIAPVQPPDGTTSNLVDPPSLENTAIAICTVMTVWATIFVAGRLYVNYKKLVLADCRLTRKLLAFVTRRLGAKLTALQQIWRLQLLYSMWGMLQ